MLLPSKTPCRCCVKCCLGFAPSHTLEQSTSFAHPRSCMSSHRNLRLPVCSGKEQLEAQLVLLLTDSPCLCSVAETEAAAAPEVEEAAEEQIQDEPSGNLSPWSPDL